MLNQSTSNRFDREVIKQVKRGKDIEKLIRVMELIIEEKPLEKKYRDHPLSGNFSDSENAISNLIGFLFTK